MDELSIHSYTAPEEGCCASSHWFRLGDEVLLFDGQMLIEDAVLLRDKMSQESGAVHPDKVIITGAHIEHYGALSEVVTEETEILATPETTRSISRRGEKFFENLAQEYGDRASSTMVLPNRKVSRSEMIDRPPFTLQFTDLKKTIGWGNLICFIPQKRILFAGDMVFNRVHPNLAKIDIDHWKLALNKLEELGARFVYPGHGQPVGGEIFSHLIRYLDHFRLAVSYFSGRHAGDQLGLYQNIAAAITDKYPDYRLPGNLQHGIEREIRRRRQAA